jgi:hypothetical protein
MRAARVIRELTLAVVVGAFMAMVALTAAAVVLCPAPAEALTCYKQVETIRNGEPVSLPYDCR